MKEREHLNEKRIKEISGAQNGWQQIFDAMPDIMAEIDPDFNIVKANKALADKLGVDRESLIGKKCHEVFHNASEPPSYCPHHLSISTGKQQFNELFEKNLNGYYLFSSTPIYDGKGVCTGTVEIGRDITARKRMEEELHKSERRFSDISENALEWVWEVDAGGKYTYSSPVVEKILGYSPSEILGKHFYDLFYQADREDLKKAAFEAFAAKQPIREFINRNIHKNGKTVWLSTSGIPILDNNGDLMGYRGSDSDITERIASEMDIREQEAMATAISSSSLDAIIVINGKGIITFFNKSAEKMFGFTQGEVIGKELHRLLVSREAMQQYFLQLPEFEKTGWCKVVGRTLDLNATKKDGSRFPIELSISVFKKNDSWYSVGSVRDITERKKIEEKLHKTSVTDELTGLLNRRGFIALAEKQHAIAKRTKRVFSMLYIDLNDLKSINDQYGHKSGDMAIVDIAAILQKTFRSSDIISRTGGDEFIVLIVEARSRDIERTITENIQRNINNHNTRAKRPYELSISMGFSHFDPAHPASINVLISQADKQMYREKKSKH